MFQNGGLKLLRAAIQSRGVWEVDLSAAPTATARTYLRAVQHLAGPVPYDQIATAMRSVEDRSAEAVARALAGTA